tara:strand:+ start:64 stop:447 length:384 start_codon:yes stop_codon:yes gene_type:complete
MKTSNRQYAKALYEVTSGLSGADLSIAIENFVQVLAKNYNLSQASSIITEFESYAKSEEGIMAIEITSASELDKGSIQAIKKTFGDKVETVEKIDPALIGGVSIKTEDKILDGSIKTQLQNMKQLLA